MSPDAHLFHKLFVHPLCRQPDPSVGQRGDGKGWHFIGRHCMMSPDFKHLCETTEQSAMIHCTLLPAISQDYLKDELTVQACFVPMLIYVPFLLSSGQCFDCRCALREWHAVGGNYAL